MTSIPYLLRIAPESPTQWPQIWRECSQSWEILFTDEQTIHWPDTQLASLLADFSDKLYALYERLPAKIMRIELARYALLYRYGGIYADMDIYCYHDFRDKLPDPNSAYVVELPAIGNRALDNALMIAPAKNPFIGDLLERAERRFHYLERFQPSRIKEIEIFETTRPDRPSTLPYAITYTTASGLITDTYQDYKGRVGRLNGYRFNMDDHSYDPRYYCKHVATRCWSPAVDSQDRSHYDYYHDYTQGRYLKRLPDELGEVAYFERTRSSHTYR